MTNRVLLAAAALAIAGAAAHAQTAPKPAAKPAAEGRTLSLGGAASAPTGKLLTREELRACIKQQETLATRRSEVDAAREPLDREKAALVKDQEALGAERERVDGLRRGAADLNVRYKAYSDRVQAWNERATSLRDQAGPSVDRQRRELDNERVKLQEEQAALEADRKRLGEDAQQAVNAFNDRAKALDGRVSDWNRRNAELSDRANAVNREREQWVENCANRRYREDDEIIIREGK